MLLLAAWLGVLVVVVLLYPGAMGVDSTVSPRTLTPTVRPADASMASTTSLLKQTARSRSTQWRDHRKLVQCVRRSEQRLVAVRSGIPLRTVDIGGECTLLPVCVHVLPLTPTPLSLFTFSSSWLRIPFHSWMCGL